MTDNSDRKRDHIDLAYASATQEHSRDDRFYYEPMLTTHPSGKNDASGYLFGKPYKYPIWVSSMTGGTGIAATINKNLAMACRDFGLGMGLGSCRKLLASDEYLADFAVRPYIGDQPLYANLGIAQVNDLIIDGKLSLIDELLKRLEADGLILHVNPLQEWMQPEGDKIHTYSPMETVEILLEKTQHKIVVKEVGQGMGPESLRALLKLPIAGLEFGAYGGTNFAKLEALRDPKTDEIDPICFVGHSPDEMIDFITDISKNETIACRDYIISGGIKNYLDGYYYNERLPLNSVYGQAAAFLKHAMDDYETLHHYVQTQVDGYMLALRYLNLNPNYRNHGK